ncbi:MAG TPA: hypothetical protein PKY82_00720 [Pyrinomonadaceae bacterium]|nr:hypothetical protein [Pyrinomonadaceae bacterium]
MSEHLSPKQIKLFLRDELTADEAGTVLLHLENCEQCHHLLPEPTREEVLGLFFAEESQVPADHLEEFNESAGVSTETPTNLKPGILSRLKRWISKSKHHFQS